MTPEWPCHGPQAARAGQAGPSAPSDPLGHLPKATSNASKDGWKETPALPSSEWLWILGAGSCWPGQLSPDFAWALPLSGQCLLL